MPDIIRYEVENHIATLTLNSPDNLNAMDEPMGRAFDEHLKKIKSDSSIRVVILTGAGRAFSSGGKLQMLEEKIQKPLAVNQQELKKFYRIFLQVRELPIPVIAALNGHAVGAGFCLALACDLRYASTKAKLGANFAKIGLAPGMGGSYFITRLLGQTHASEVLLLAELLSAKRALEMGLVNGIYEPSSLMSHVHGAAKVIAENGPIAIQMIKKGIQKALHSNLEEMFEYDAVSQAKCFATQDLKEGVRAVQEKRAPRFIGK